MPKHKGGKLDVWDSKGRKVDTIHYGPGLNKDCGECGKPKGKTCVTATGKSLNKSHKSRS